MDTKNNFENMVVYDWPDVNGLELIFLNEQLIQISDFEEHQLQVENIVLELIVSIAGYFSNSFIACLKFTNSMPCDVKYSISHIYHSFQVLCELEK